MTTSWRCDNCNYLMYNVQEISGTLYPCYGAPESKYVNKLYPHCCTLCFELHQIVSVSSYFMKHHTEWENRKDSCLGKPKDNGWST